MNNETVEEFKAVVVNTFAGLKDPDQIAELCRQKGIQGFIANSTSCPIVKLIKEQINSCNVAFSVDKNTYFWCFSIERSVYFPAYSVCEEFSKKFDNGDYPDLIAFRELK